MQWINILCEYYDFSFITKE